MRRLNSAFWLLFTGQLLSATGITSTAVVLPFVVLRVTGDLVQAGVLGFVIGAATVVGKLPGGALADRFDRRLLMLGCDLTRLLGMALLTVAVADQWISLPLLLAVGTMEGILGSTFAAASTGAVRQLVPEHQWPRALGTLQIVSATSVVGGPLLGGTLLTWSPALPFGFNAATYALSALCLTAIRRSLPVEVPEERLWPSVVIGLRFVTRTPFLLYAAVNAAVLNLIFNGLVLVLIASAAEAGHSFFNTGLQVAALGTGMLVGSGLAPIVATRVPPGWGTAASTAATAVPLAMFSVFSTGWPSMMLLALTATAMPLINVLMGNTQMRLTPNALQGRVHSTVTLMATAVAPLGPILAGLATDAFGITPTILTAACVVAALAFSGWWIAIRWLDPILSSDQAVRPAGTRRRQRAHEPPRAR